MESNHFLLDSEVENLTHSIIMQILAFDSELANNGSDLSQHKILHIKLILRNNYTIDIISTNYN